MANQERKYPLTIALYKNKFNTEKTVLSSFPVLEQEQADELCAAIQAAVGGTIEVREKGGTSQNGKRLPDFELRALSPQEITERKAFGAKQKAERDAQSAGDDSL